MAEATQNGENLVKLSQKMVGKLRGFLKKVGDGLTTVPHVPGAIFTFVKKHKEKKKKEEIENVVKEVLEKTKEPVKTEEKAQEQGPTVSIFDNAEDKDAEDKKDKKKSSEKSEKIRIIEGISGAELKEKATKKSETKENEPIQPITIEIPEQTKLEKVEVEEKEDVKEEKPKKKKKDLKDLTIFNNYEEYKRAYFWNYYLNRKEFDVEVLEEVSKILAKRADGKAKSDRDLLTEAQFNSRRAEQVKAKEIAEIEKVHDEELEAAEAKRVADVQAAIDERQAEVDDLNNKLTDSRSKNRTLMYQLKVNSEALAQIKDAVAPLGIQKIDDIIDKAAKKCEGIDKRAAEREKERDAAIESEVDKKMADIYGKLSGNREEVKVEKPAEDTKVAFEQPADQPQVVEAEKLVQAEESVQPEKPVEEERTVNLVFETPKEETEEVKGGNELLNEISDPTTFDADKFYMGFDPETRAEIGQEALERWKNSDNSITFDEAKEQVAQEYGQSKGRTR